ncbi:hypothetical protein ACTA71_011259 [Dictyostelium dimigraforme]
MSSIQIRQTKERISRLSKEDRLQFAVEYYNLNRGSVTQKEVGAYYDVPHYEISRSNERGNKSNRILSKDQEAQLLVELEQIIDQGIPVTREMAMDMALKLYKDRTGIAKETLSDEWWRVYRKDNPSVKLKITKSKIATTRKNKSQGCKLTSTKVSGLVTYRFDERKGKKTKSATNNNLTLVQNNIQINNNNNVVQLSTPISRPNLVEPSSTIQKSTSTVSSIIAMPSLDEKLKLFLDSISKKKKNIP